MNEPIITIIIIIFTVCFSIRGFKDSFFQSNYMFDSFPIRYKKEYYRMFTSALLHLHIPHLVLNMLCLYSFSINIEQILGREVFLLIYIGSILGGNLLSYWIHRNHDYRALGASGGVSGVMLASIFVFPGGSLSLLFLPHVAIPAWLFVILFIGISMYGMQTGIGANIGHDAHLGGAITGLLITTILYPRIIYGSPKLFAFVIITCSFFLFYLIKNPLLLHPKHFFKNFSKPKLFSKKTIDAAYRTKSKTEKEEEQKLDQLLEKISAEGISSLTTKEREILHKISKKKQEKLK